jgi:hypothetical protein
MICSLGALIDMGIPEYEAKRYEGKVKDGNILLSVHTEDSKERDRAKKILEPVAPWISPIPAKLLFPRNSSQPLTDKLLL